ncbi:hypothetical protein HNY73_018985 [Argiope bruennichi]|uniref:Uncharacterized protein n=1 Tax=Argiope bruennichi TaxID=94029 RepID=A0A8T0EI56_ARGBR|nr:hypothetical protein HNY73_018985 [Argiope bruennichi]
MLRSTRKTLSHGPIELHVGLNSDRERRRREDQTDQHFDEDGTNIYYRQVVSKSAYLNLDFPAPDLEQSPQSPESWN